MAYTPTEWATGDVITAQKLNKMEQGIADAGAGAGLQLYGPYFGFGEAPLDAGTEGYCGFDSYKTINGATVNLPEQTDGGMAVIASVKIEGCVIMGFNPPHVVPSGGRVHWEHGSMTLFNPGAQAATPSCEMAFYSTIEFPEA